LVGNVYGTQTTRNNCLTPSFTIPYPKGGLAFDAFAVCEAKVTRLRLLCMDNYFSENLTGI
jgi:hypothetical protein